MDDIADLDFPPYTDLTPDQLRAAWTTEAGHVAAWRAKIAEAWAIEGATEMWKRQRSTFFTGCIDGSLAVMAEYEDALLRQRVKPTDVLAPVPRRVIL